MAEPIAGSSSSGGQQKDTGKRTRESYELAPPESGTTPSTPCGACKFLRRKCVKDCIFAPYFTSDHAAALFAAVHKVFGASNVSKLLMHIPVHWRQHAVMTISYEAQARLSDPVYGCIATVIALQQQVEALRTEIAMVQNQLLNNRFVMASALQGSLQQPELQPENASSASLQQPQQVHHPELLQPRNASSASLQQPQPVDHTVLQPVYSNAASASDNNIINLSSFDYGVSNLAGDHQSAVHSQPGFDPLQLSLPCYEDEDDNEKESGDPFAFLDQML